MSDRTEQQAANADVIVIGAGIAGLSAAWFLQQAGLRVVVCEKGVAAGEQSGRNWGWIRQTGRDEAELPIVMESMQRWQEIADQLETDIGYRREGTLYLCETEDDMAKNDRFMKFAPQYGVSSTRINRAQLEKLIRDCPTRWHSALHTPDDGRAEPSLAAQAIAQTLQSRGVTVLENCATESISTSGGTVDGVITEQGEIKAQAVLIAAGAWSTFLLEDCGVRLPQLTVKASVARTGPMPSIFEGNASGSQVAFRRRLDGGYTVAASDRLEVFPSLRHMKFLPDFWPMLKAFWPKLKFRVPELQIDGDYKKQRICNPIPTEATFARIRSRLADRVPAFTDVEFVEAWSGMIDALPDVVPVLDRAPLDGLWIATGFSGHGFGIGPAAGRIMADLIQNNAAEHDLYRFRLSRFTDGSPIILGPAI